MGVFSGVFVGVSLVLTPILGSAGYIVANIVNMTCRCIHHGLYLNRVGGDRLWRGTLPDGRWLASMAVISGLLCVNENRSLPYSLHSLVCHLSVGVVAGVFMLGLLYLFDKKLIQEGKKMLRNKQE